MRTLDPLDILASQQASVAEIQGTPGTPDVYEQSGFKYSPPWVNPPDNFQSFDKYGIIATPAIGAGDIEVLNYFVPFGSDGVIKAISNNYSGAGFQQGSGGIVWRILIDGRAVKNYENIQVEFGSVQSPRSIFGIRIYQGQLVQYMVNILGAGGFIPAGETQIVCCISGWIYPRALA